MYALDIVFIAFIEILTVADIREKNHKNQTFFHFGYAEQSNDNRVI